MQPPHPDRWLRPSAAEGAWLLALASDQAPRLSLDDHIRLLKTTYSCSGFDFATGREILAHIGLGPMVDKPTFYRSMFLWSMRELQPPVLQLLLRGREAFVQALSAEAVQCLDICGAMAAVPEPATIQFLDTLAALARQQQNAANLQKGREAERLSWDLEMGRLREMGCSQMPRWVALDDNAAGFDLLSWSDVACHQKRLIEVKACTARLPHFHLSQNEIATGKRNPHCYILHIWGFPQCRLLELAWPELEPFLPEDGARSRIENVSISWPEW